MIEELLELGNGSRLHYRRTGSGEPLLLAMGTAACLGMWMPVEATLADRFDVVSFDYRGLGDSERGDGPITAGTLAEDCRALLEALSIPRAHVLGWSLGSVVAQELTLIRPDLVASLVLYGTWARPDGVMTALMTALKYPWEQGDLATALATLGVVYSPEFLVSPEFETFLAWTTPLTPSTPNRSAPSPSNGRSTSTSTTWTGSAPSPRPRSRSPVSTTSSRRRAMAGRSHSACRTRRSS
jgi:pimeloyl-ACP methyl ester carboxylesterase